MTMKIYIGTVDEITARLAGAPNATETTVATAESSQVFTLTATTSFSADDSIVIGKEKGVIESLAGSTVTLLNALSATPTVGATVRHYDSDYTKYRDQGQPFVFIDDRKIGGRTGNPTRDLTLFDFDGLMPDIVAQNRITIFDSADAATSLFAGVVLSSLKTMRTKDRSNVQIYEWTLEAEGYQWEADSVGINELPFVNVNAGDFLTYLLGKWTTLSAGEIDISASPVINYIRLSNQRRFSQVGTDLAGLWAGSEFYIGNTHTGGLVYFRQSVANIAPITLSSTYLERIGNREDQYVKVRKDYDKTFNMILFPFYREIWRAPDFHVQSTVSDDAFLKSTVTLAGQPSSVDETTLFYDDFADGALSDQFLEYDLTNPSPPDGFNSADGFLVEGEVNGVPGLHMLDTTGTVVKKGQIARLTDPASLQPFTGEEGQTIHLKEFVVDGRGDGVLLGILDQSSIQTLTISGSTTTKIYVQDRSMFSGLPTPYENPILVGGVRAYINGVGTDGGGQYLGLLSALAGAPAAGVVVEMDPVSPQRFKFGVIFTSNSGQMAYYKYDGTTSSIGGLDEYLADTTYSLRVFMQCFETTIASGISSTGCTLTSATNFATNDIVEIFTRGSAKQPEIKKITKSGSNITYSATTYTPSVGYRIRTKPKLVWQMKGGTYGDINGRTWTTMVTAPNTWKTSETADPPPYGVLICSNQTLIGTITQFSIKNPPPIYGNIGTRYLHIGTQEVDSQEPDTDCIVRKVGSHFQLDFFPDTKGLWSSGTTLELRYKNRERVELQSNDIDSIRAIARVRGHELTGTESEQELIRLGGRALDSIEILPTPLTDGDALSQSEAILAAVKDAAITAEILTNTYLDDICQSGQILKSTIPGIPDQQIQRVELQELAGAQKEDGSSLYRQRITAGTVDRLTDILQKRVLASAGRLVLDDGVTDDTFTRVQKSSVSEIAVASDDFEVTTPPFFFITEDGNRLITEGGDYLVSEGP